MLEIGTHINFKQLKQYKMDILRITVASIAAGLACSSIYKYYWHANIFQSLIMGFCALVSSTVIASHILLKNNRLINKYGQISLIGTIVQDMIGIVLIALTSPGEIHAKLLIYIPATAIFLIVVHFLRRNDNLDNQHDTFIPFLFVLQIAAEYAEKLHISSELIFFLVGLIIDRFYNEYTTSICGSIYNPFIGLMILTSIQHIDSAILLQHMPHILLTFLAISIIKITFISLSFIRSVRSIDAIRIALILLANSELGFFLVSRLELDPTLSTVIYAVTVLSMFLSPILFKVVDSMINRSRLTHIGLSQQSLRNYLHSFEKKYFIVIGITRYSDMLIEKLNDKVFSAIVLDVDAQKILRSKNENFFMLDALMRDTYKDINFSNVIDIFICINVWQKKIAILKTIRSINKDINIQVFCFDTEEAGYIERYQKVDSIFIDEATFETKFESVLNNYEEVY